MEESNNKNYQMRMKNTCQTKILDLLISMQLLYFCGYWSFLLCIVFPPYGGKNCFHKWIEKSSNEDTSIRWLCSAELCSIFWSMDDWSKEGWSRVEMKICKFDRFVDFFVSRGKFCFRNKYFPYKTKREESLRYGKRWM